MQKKLTTRYIACLAMFAAIAYIAVLIGLLIPNVSGFLSYEPKDAVIVIAGFIFGPIASIIITLIVSFIEMVTISSTGIYGFIMNAVATCAFAVPATVIYKKYRTKKSAVIGLVASVAVMAAVMVAWNYIITPLYMGVPREQVAGMLATVFLPFNLVKGGINAALAMLLYKPVVGALRKTGLVEAPQNTQKHKFSAVSTIITVALLITFVLLFLALAEVI